MVLVNTNAPDIPDNVKAYVEGLAATRAAERQATNGRLWKTDRKANHVRVPVPSDPRSYKRGDKDKDVQIADGSDAQPTSPLDTEYVVVSEDGYRRNVGRAR